MPQTLRRAGGHPVSDEPVTVLFSRQIKAGRQADFEAWAHGVTTVAHFFPGHLGASVLNASGSREYHVLYTFADRASMEAWLDSDERYQWLARVNEMTDAERGLQKVTGLETWFKLPGSNVPTMKPPPRWKMWLVSIVAVYPLGLLFQVLLAPTVRGTAAPSLGISSGVTYANDFRGHAASDAASAPLACSATRRLAF